MLAPGRVVCRKAHEPQVFAQERPASASEQAAHIVKGAGVVVHELKGQALLVGVVHDDVQRLLPHGVGGVAQGARALPAVLLDAGHDVGIGLCPSAACQGRCCVLLPGRQCRDGPVPGCSLSGVLHCIDLYTRTSLCTGAAVRGCSSRQPLSGMESRHGFWSYKSGVYLPFPAMIVCISFPKIESLV